MDRLEVTCAVLEVLSDASGRELTGSDLDQTFDDLGLDSLEVLDACAELEDRLGMDEIIAKKEFEMDWTIRQLIDVVERKL